MVQGKFYKNSDLDIYFPKAHPKWTGKWTSMVALLKQHGYEAGDAPDGEPNYDYELMMIGCHEQRSGFGDYYESENESDDDLPGRRERVGFDLMLVQPYRHASSGKVVQVIAQRKCCMGSDRVPKYLKNFDLTVCCVALFVGKDGQLHWLMPYVKDILNGVLDATPFLSSLDLSLRCGASKKRERTIARVLKYTMRGFHPTPILLKKFAVDVEDELDSSVAALRLW